MPSVAYKCVSIIIVAVTWLSDISGIAATYKVRLSPSWYPGHRFELAEALQKHEAQALQKYNAHLDSSAIRALVVPHAGYAYSGDVAAAAYQLITPDYFNKIIIIGPSHHESFMGVGLPDKRYDYLKTVHGYLTLDTKVLRGLSQQGLFKYQGHVHEAEHAINIQLPFIQKFCGKKCMLVPLLVGDVTHDQIKQIAAVLKPEIDNRTLVIISSDFTHYGQRFGYTPFTKDITQKIFEMDTQVIEKVQNHDLQGFDDVLQKTKSTVCGANAIKILLELIDQQAFGDVTSHIVAYDTSASSQINPDHSVSYLSLVLSEQKVSDLPVQHRLTGYEKSLLLRLARQQLQDAVLGVKRDAIRVPGLLTNSLRQGQGSFVTLYTLNQEGDRRLRGCIGTLSDAEPLYKTVHAMTEFVALRDTRFDQVTKEELPYVEIALSVLTPQRFVNSYRDIMVGQHGVAMHHGDASAVYLPKVAAEQGWTLEQMLTSLCQKAGLDKICWQSPETKLQVFEGIDFAENIDPLSIMYKGYKK